MRSLAATLLEEKQNIHMCDFISTKSCSWMRTKIQEKMATLNYNTKIKIKEWIIVNSYSFGREEEKWSTA